MLRYSGSGEVDTSSYNREPYLRSNEPFQSSGTYGLLMLPKEVESLVKVLLPPFAITTELYWAHDVFQ